MNTPATAAMPASSPETAERDARLREDVRLLGRLLGETLKRQAGEGFFDRVEQVRRLVRAADGNRRVAGMLEALSAEELLTIARAFTHFLNLANIAEQHHRMRCTLDNARRSVSPLPTTLLALFGRLKEKGFEAEQVQALLQSMSIELVLTAHPTEISRRTIIQKYDVIAERLEVLDRQDLTPHERARKLADLAREVEGAWHTDEIRQTRPTPMDEARWGFAVIENTLWRAVPAFLRSMDTKLKSEFGFGLPLDSAPVRFASWMGGDRDGNPNVTSAVTREVILLSHWKAMDLLRSDIDQLRGELSMADASAELRARVGNVGEPYREWLRRMRDRIDRTLALINARLRNERVDIHDVYSRRSEFFDDLMLCYRSLMECGMTATADGRLSDLLRAVSCFGLNLVRLDIREESTRHTRVLSAITQWLEIGDYQQWDEQQRQEFLLRELQSRRPLVNESFFEASSCPLPEAELAETLSCFGLLAHTPRDAYGSYVISMAGAPSDVLAVYLLQKAAGVHELLPVVPLFETWNDLEHAAVCVDQLLSLPWFRKHCHNGIQVMIGYSDSAKDAGFLAASWAQYRAQEGLTAVCAKHGVALTLFHGRGGSVSRGGAPAHTALLSQPPGSVNGSIRITEQGEVIRYNYGLFGIALMNLELYTSATMEVSLLPPPAPKPEWLELMNLLSDLSMRAYKSRLRHPHFVRYLRTITPELELAKLPLGSRPARRHNDGGIESLRAIPWVFAWTQIRLMLTAWLGTGVALREALAQGHGEMMREMAASWPYFRMLLDMLEMVLAKAAPEIAARYEERLTQDPDLLELGAELRQELADTIEALKGVVGIDGLLQNYGELRRAMEVRDAYCNPLNLMQAELMHRYRHTGEQDPMVERALMVTIAGIAAGMRNTG